MNHKPRTQYSTRLQGFEKQVFWALGMETCPQCNTKTIKKELDVCAVRPHNGDAYGVAIFTCKKCDFKTSFQYDDQADSYYYEASYWKRDDILKQWKKQSRKV